MSFTEEIIKGITGNLSTDCLHWVSGKVANTAVARDIEAKLNPDGQHAKTRAILEVAMTDALREMKLTSDEYAAWKAVLLHPEIRLQLIGWVLDWEENPKPRIEEWSLENAPHPGRLRRVLRRLHTQIQIAKRRHFGPEFFNLLSTLARQDGKLDGLAEQADRNTDRILERLPKASVAPLLDNPHWPAPWVRETARWAPDHFVGRVHELEQMRDAMARGDKVVCVLGQGGQGKSSLLAAWRDPANEPPGAVGCYWCRPYDPRYNFEECLDDLHRYLRGTPLDRQKLTRPDQRLAEVSTLLKIHPCVIVLDGLERWLVRWAADSEASAEGATDADRASMPPGLDDFLRDAANWPKGAALVFSSRALPSALDGLPYFAVGKSDNPAQDNRLPDFTAEDTLELFAKLGVRIAIPDATTVTKAWGGHPLALHLLGWLLAKRYGGDGTRWQEISPLDQAKLKGLLDAVLDHHAADRPLLEAIACHVGPAPLTLLVDLCDTPEPRLREQLAALNAWQLVEFDGERTDQHALIRAYLRGCLGTEARLALTRKLALWWADQDIAPNPQDVQELRSRLNAVEHALEAHDVKLVDALLYGRVSSNSHYGLEEWLRLFGVLAECITINDRTIELHHKLGSQERNHELSSGLAACYNSRGTAFLSSGNVANALADYDNAIMIYEELVNRDGCSEFRDRLAKCYSNRGAALAHLDENSATLEDLGRAIEIYKVLIKHDGRSDLRDVYAMSYNNRGVAHANLGNFAEALTDYGNAIGIIGRLVERERRKDLRDELAKIHNNRGNAYANLEEYEVALADFGYSIAIREELVNREGRRELRSNLAKSYNNRGITLRHLGDFSTALADYNNAITLYNKLVGQEGRNELRWDLCMCLFNRASLHVVARENVLIVADLERGLGLARDCLEDGQSQHLADYVKFVNAYIYHAPSINATIAATRHANDGLTVLADAMSLRAPSEVLERDARTFLSLLEVGQEWLAPAGLDLPLRDRVAALLAR